MNSPQVQHIVKHNKRFLVITLVPTLVLLIVALLLRWLDFAVLLCLVSPFFVFLYTKSKLTYDGEGITIHDPLLGQTFVRWEDVTLIEHVYGYPYPYRPGIDVLKIVYNVKDVRGGVVYYDFLTYSGLIELLVFYDTMQH
ncbi:MAG: hypothetical protein IKS35_07425 [Clostridia bacterium]|nr:hypothetical protein [Clostridia bacterium]